MVCRAAKKVRDEVDASPRRGIPIIFSEYNATYFNEPQVTDSLFMGPWLADTLRRCDGLTDMMSYWTFSDVFEEQGVVKRPFYGGFGLIAAGGIPKPVFNAFKILHGLGTERYDAASEHALVTRGADGSFVIALWNYAPPGGSGAPITCHCSSATLRRVGPRTASRCGKRRRQWRLPPHGIAGLPDACAARTAIEGRDAARASRGANPQ